MKTPCLCLPLLLLIVCVPMPAQTRQEVVARSIGLFAEGRYAEAQDGLASIVADNERDPKVNFYLGASSVMSGRDLADAIRRLRVAQTRNFMKAEANFYLGRAYQLTCEYEQAREAFARFLPVAKDEAMAAEARRYDQECASATQIAGKIFNVKVLAKTKLANDDLLSAYGVSKEAGIVCRNSRFFQSDIDPQGIMYMTERADAAYFSIADDSGRDKLMTMEKLIGGWGEMTRVAGVEADEPSDDRTPFLLTDGQTLYFASNRPGGMGGYDIYMSSYDSEARRFSAPVNMGVPFNSPYDDYLFAPDDFAHRAWFASNRETFGADSVVVYQIVWDGSVIRSMAQTTEEISRALSLPVDASAASLPAATTRRSTGAAAGAKAAPPRADAFRLAVCDTLTYSQWEHFRNPQAASAYRLALAAAAEKDSVVRVMAAQRKEFMGLTSGIERNAKLQELLQTERSIYALDDEVADKTEAARNAELRTLEELIAKGRYVPLCKIVVGAPAKEKNERVRLVPADFSSFSPLFFSEARANADEALLDILTPGERSAVVEQDSLLAWAQILSMEAERIEAGADSAADVSGRAPRLRRAAQELAVEAYDAKIAALDGAYRRLLPAIRGYDKSELADLYAQASTLVSQAERVKSAGGEMVAGKRRAAAAMERCLSRYASHADGSFPLPEAADTAEVNYDDQVMTLPIDRPVRDVVVDSVAKPTANYDDQVMTLPIDRPVRDVVVDSVAKPEANYDDQVMTLPIDRPVRDVVVDSVAKPKANYDDQVMTLPSYDESDVPAFNPARFRIQLGVFRKRPDALDRLPNPAAVSSLFLEERNLTRYYYGAYATRQMAQDELHIARKAGFTGAFVTEVADK